MLRIGGRDSCFLLGSPETAASSLININVAAVTLTHPLTLGCRDVSPHDGARH